MFVGHIAFRGAFLNRRGWLISLGLGLLHIFLGVFFRCLPKPHPVYSDEVVPIGEKGGSITGTLSNKSRYFFLRRARVDAYPGHLSGRGPNSRRRHRIARGPIRLSPGTKFYERHSSRDRGELPV